MAPIIVWVAVGVFVFPSGPDTQITDAMVTKAECEAKIADVEKRIAGPEGDTIRAYGQTCVAITVSVKKMAPAKVKPQT